MEYIKADFLALENKARMLMKEIFQGLNTCKFYHLTLQIELDIWLKFCKFIINNTHQGYASIGEYPQIGGFFLFVGRFEIRQTFPYS